MGLFDYQETAIPDVPLDEITFLADLSDQDWARVLKIVETRQFRPGEDLIKCGDNDQSFYILTNGEVELLVNNTGSETVLATIQEGSVFGEIAFFDGAPRSATIRAKSTGSTIRITRDTFDNLAIWEPQIARQMLFDLGRVLAMRLRWTTTLASQ